MREPAHLLDAQAFYAANIFHKRQLDKPEEFYDIIYRIVNNFYVKQNNLEEI